MSKIYRVPALDTNYIWIIQPDTAQNQVWIIDPGESAPVLKLLAQHALEPVALLITHHHKDHTGGIAGILDVYDLPVYGPESDRIPQITHFLRDGDQFNLGHLPVTVISTPGHTLDSHAYRIQPDTGPDWLFCGDALFSGGCGRVFEGTLPQALTSIQRLAGLDDNTKVYCGHEYTHQNLLFAHHVEPDNVAIGQRLDNIGRQMTTVGATLPSTIALEKQINPYLRLDSPTIQRSLEAQYGQKISNEVEVFAHLRRWKDHF